VPATPEELPEVVLLLALVLLAFVAAKIEFGLLLAKPETVYVMSGSPVRSTSASDLCVPVGSAALTREESTNMEAKPRARVGLN
tara:strand:- start:1119 stop:1370 length:252 start_codon:yes stop_codon:yes gene_type:complete